MDSRLRSLMDYISGEVTICDMLADEIEQILKAIFEPDLTIISTWNSSPKDQHWYIELRNSETQSWVHKHSYHVEIKIAILNVYFDKIEIIPTSRSSTGVSSHSIEKPNMFDDTILAFCVAAGRVFQETLLDFNEIIRLQEIQKTLPKDIIIETNREITDRLKQLKQMQQLFNKRYQDYRSRTKDNQS